MLWEKDLKILNGQRIKQININGDDELFITTDKGIHKFRVEGDCCSHSYFYEINNINQMLSWCAKDIEEINIDLLDDSEELCTYGYKIHTEGGYGLIVFRNASNGYYGGFLEYDGLVDNVIGIEIREDWNVE